MDKAITLTANEIKVLILILSVDMDALGVEPKSAQAAARSVLKKLKS